MEKNCCFHTILCICLYTKTAANQLSTVRASGKGVLLPHPLRLGSIHLPAKEESFLLTVFVFAE